VRYESIAGSVIGYAYFPTPDTCRQTVQARIDNTFNASLATMAELLTHEYKGHSDGLEHTNGGIMNPSIGNPTSRATWIGDPSFGWKRRYFGGSPLPTGPVDPSPPPPPPNPDPPPSPPPPPPSPPPVPPSQIEMTGTVRVPVLAMSDPSGSFTVTLLFPLKSGTETLTDLVIRRPKFKHLRAMDSKKGDIEKSQALLAAVSGRASKELDEMDQSDMAVCAAVLAFFSRKRQPTGARI
jgi:hypothetical protein